jgi:hypothetical protein
MPDTRPDPLARVLWIADGTVQEFPVERQYALNMAHGLRSLAEHERLTDVYVSLQWYDTGRIAWEWELRAGATHRDPDGGRGSDPSDREA